uniref:Secreted protein n=1 Tax=Colobus angolensis palliatus TaxID=336983 RepID=A0A2K5KBP0_COLAP
MFLFFILFCFALRYIWVKIPCVSCGTSKDLGAQGLLISLDDQSTVCPKLGQFGELFQFLASSACQQSLGLWNRIGITDRIEVTDSRRAGSCLGLWVHIGKTFRKRRMLVSINSS